MNHRTQQNASLTQSAGAACSPDPVRLRLQRRRGADIQVLSRATNGRDAVAVTRPGPWGNPFIVGKHGTAEQCVDLYEKLLSGLVCVSLDRPCVEAQERALKYATEHLEKLRGKNLACFCALDAPCHADVLLRVANTNLNSASQESEHHERI